MDRIKRRQFVGNYLIFLILCLTGVLIPIAILYLINCTIEIEYEVSDAEEFMEYHVSKKKK